jgi:hypothetical protein
MANEEPPDRMGPDASPDSRPDPSVGLCERCVWSRVQGTKRGSVFYRCGRADENDAFLRYPPLPVDRCSGFERESN